MTVLFSRLSSDMTTPVFSLHTEGVWWVDPGWTLCPPVMLYNSSSSAGQGKEYNQRHLGQDKDRERSLLITVMGKIDLTWGKQFDCQSN